jgi:hypothetical protein
MHTIYFTVLELAEMAGCSKINIQKHIERGHLDPSFRQGRYGRDRGGRHMIHAAGAFRFLAKYRPQSLASSAQP